MFHASTRNYITEQKYIKNQSYTSE